MWCGFQHNQTHQFQKLSETFHRSYVSSMHWKMSTEKYHSPQLLSGCSLSLAIIWKNVASKIFPQNPQNRNTCHFISDSIKFCGNLFGLWWGLLVVNKVTIWEKYHLLQKLFSWRFAYAKLSFVDNDVIGRGGSVSHPNETWSEWLIQFDILT